jgi:preprotein translocase subunit SecD
MRRRSLLVVLVTVGLAFGSLATVLGLGYGPVLGLDLQGGASVTLQAVGEIRPGALDVAERVVRDRVDSLGVAEPEIVRQDDAIVVNLPGVTDQDRALALIGRTAELRFRPVLGILPGPDAAVPVDTATSVASSTPPPSSGATATTVPGGTDTTAATTTTVAGGTDTTTTTAAPAAGRSVPLPQQSTDSTTTSSTIVPEQPIVTVPPSTTTTLGPTVGPNQPAPDTQTRPEDDDPDQPVTLPQRDDDGKVRVLYQLGPAVLTGSAISDATARLPQSQWIVELVLKNGVAGLDTWNEWAGICFARQERCPTNQMAFVLDSVVISAPAFQEAFFDSNTISITGGGQTGFKEAEAKDLAKLLNAGALPIKLEPQAVQTVSATLGKDSLRAGVIAGVIGVALVVAFMLFYYRLLAVVVLAGLLVSAAIAWTVISWMGVVLTLSGATGIIVSIGVTVDSYVVYFERLKDDVRSGRSLRSSAQRGFAGAWRTILAADIVSLIGAGLLFWLTVGSVRGFAFFLGLSTLIDMVVAYFFTRPLVQVLAGSSRFDGDKVLGVSRGEARLAGGAQ